MISTGGIIRCNARAMADLAVPLPPAMTKPPIDGLTAKRINADLIVSCPTINDNGISNFVFDSDVLCKDGLDIAFLLLTLQYPEIKQQDF